MGGAQKQNTRQPHASCRLRAPRARGLRWTDLWRNAAPAGRAARCKADCGRALCGRRRHELGTAAGGLRARGAGRAHTPLRRDAAAQRLQARAPLRRAPRRLHPLPRRRPRGRRATVPALLDRRRQPRRGRPARRLGGGGAGLARGAAARLLVRKRHRAVRTRFAGVLAALCASSRTSATRCGCAAQTRPTTACRSGGGASSSSARAVGCVTTARARRRVVSCARPSATSGAEWQNGHDAHTADARTYRGHVPSSLDAPCKCLTAGTKGNSGGAGLVILDDGTQRYLTIRELARCRAFRTPVFCKVWYHAERAGAACPPLLAGRFAEDRPPPRRRYAIQERARRRRRA